MNAHKKRILVVDDEPRILDAVSAFLESKGYEVYQAETGSKALELFERNNIQLLVLDLMLPDLSGEEVCRQIRRQSRVPILMLTAKSEEDSHLHGLEIGADDYLTKPFSLKVLQAHIEAILRRSADDLIPLTAKNSWQEGDLIVDMEQNLVLKRGVPVNLTLSERKLLGIFIKYPGKVFTREELIEIAFGNDFDGYDRTIDTHIKNLRQKIEDQQKSPVYIQTVHGVGYKFGGK